MLNALDVPNFIAARILKDFSPSFIEAVEDLEKYRATGYNDSKNIIRFTKYEDNSSKVFICQAYVLKHYYTTVFGVKNSVVERFDDWMQIWCRIVPDDADWNKAVVNGQKAWNSIQNILRSKYSPMEIDQILRSHSAEYDERKIQFHFNFMPENKNSIEIFDNCQKYDICGAHHDALREMFPKCAAAFEKLYEERKQKPENKMIANFFVGMLCRKGYRGTYNWIVQRTSNLLHQALKQVKGYLVYANTDGFIVYKGNSIVSSNELGSFRLEYEGPVCICCGSNYWIYQTKDEIKGSIPLNLRSNINLFEGKTVSYDISGKHIKDRNGKEFLTIREYSNIKEEICNVVKL